MPEATDTQSEESKPIVRYKWEYNKFLEFVRQHKVSRAIIYAKALQIDRRTLSNWMNQPELREALIESLDELVEGMQSAGSKDWRMHRELLKMMGVDDEQKIDLTSDGERIETTPLIISQIQARKPDATTETEATASS
jgi:hypothetical protein